MSATSSLERNHVRKPSPDQCKRIVVAAPKGGVGKTTLVMALLVCARLDSMRACGVNMDEQETLAKWAEYRSFHRKVPDTPEIVDAPVLVRRLDDFRAVKTETDAGFEIALYDTPPGHSHYRQAVRRLCGQADVVLIPTGASDVDLEEVIPFGIEVGPKAIFLLNKVNRRTIAYQRARKRLNHAGELCPIDIPMLEIIHNQFKLGLAAPDTEALGTDDFKAVWEFLRRKVAP